jgi:hypothetical protein
MPEQTLLTFHAMGDWPAQAVCARWVADSRPRDPQVEELIEAAWREATRRPGVWLFDGPMCRLESWHADPHRLELSLSKTSYKPFVGTNMAHPELAKRLGRNILANPVGVSPLLQSADGFLMMGRRNASVAYYPHRIHPFAGALDHRDGLDIFAALAREWREELHFAPQEILSARCTGIAEDMSILQPELILRCTTSRPRSQIEAQLDQTEHQAAWAIPAELAAVEKALAEQRDVLTPVAVAALLLWGRITFGDPWFTRQAADFVAP